MGAVSIQKETFVILHCSPRMCALAVPEDFLSFTECTAPSLIFVRWQRLG
jgi:hypothetical protein